jgi:membrane protein implicated in regulation of membrane protease activity
MVVAAVILARHWLDLPTWIAVVVVSLWVVKDIALFPFVWRAYDKTRPGDPYSMIGARGIAQERLAPSGYVLVGRELWRAEMMEPGSAVEKGEAVRVREIKGLTLMVERETDEEMKKGPQL